MQCAGDVVDTGASGHTGLCELPYGDGQRASRRGDRVPEGGGSWFENTLIFNANDSASSRVSELYVHVPTPGDHYSPATGSATMTVIYELSRQHAAAGGRTRIVAGRGTRHDYDVGECSEVDFRGLPSRRQKAADIGLGALGLSRRFTVGAYRPALDAVDRDFEGALVVHNSPAGLALLARERPRARTVLYTHNTLFRTYGRRELRRIAGRAFALVFVSEFLADDLAHRLGSTRVNRVVVRNGVDVERFRPDSGARREGEDPIVLFVGRVIPEKGPDILLRAAVKLRSRRRRFRVRIVGSSGFSASDPLTPYERHLRTLATPLGAAAEFVPFVGRDRIVDEYRRADVMCVPSNCDEGSTLTVPEAVACGLPTVASRRGGVHEVGGDAVLYFDPPNVDELAELLAYLLDDPSAREEWGQRARSHAMTLTWAPQYRKLRDALEA